MQPPGSLRWRTYGESGDAGMQNSMRGFPRNPLSPDRAPRPRPLFWDERDSYGAPIVRSPTVERSDSRSAPFLVLFITVSAFKLLLIPAYRSTDFEVHRNWLAVTHSLPLSKWYYEATSEWTLDYPPLFAWMERFLSYFGKFFDEKMLVVANLKYASQATIVFQRLSVILLDATFVYATYQGYRYLVQRSLGSKSRAAYSPGTIYACLMLWNVGLLIVDHIHFQYNGFLLGFVQLAVIRMVEKRYFAAAFWFSVALNFKHIFLYMAPPFGIFLLRQCCFPDGVSMKNFNSKAFVILGGIFAGVSSISLGPFLYLSQLDQVFRRLFPFQRGLTHAYWAPNFWALYNTADRVLTVGATKLRLIELNGTGALTGGLVGEQEHTVLPSITPAVTMLLTVFGMVPALWMLWNAKTGDQFIKGLTICTLSSFLFGWHVHEKAILLVTIPYTWLAINNYKDARIYLVLVTAGYFGLHPLLFTPAEIPLKYMMIFLYGYVVFKLLKDRFPLGQSAWSLFPLLNSVESLYILGFFIVAFYGEVVHPWVLHLDTKLPFLPLMFTSAYSALGIVYAYLKLLTTGLRIG